MVGPGQPSTSKNTFEGPACAATSSSIQCSPPNRGWVGDLLEAEGRFGFPTILHCQIHVELPITSVDDATHSLRSRFTDGVDVRYQAMSSLGFGILLVA